MLCFSKIFTNFFENIFDEQKLPSSSVADFLGQNVKFFEKILKKIWKIKKAPLKRWKTESKGLYIIIKLKIFIIYLPTEREELIL